MISGKMTPAESSAGQKALDSMQLLFNDYKPTSG
jgi:hypothetical protein